jgi:hypothetical protein
MMGMSKGNEHPQMAIYHGYWKSPIYQSVNLPFLGGQPAQKNVG